MGCYDGNDLNYYYFMVSKFATSDRWFSPVMTRTEPNRLYLLAGTSAGHAYPLEDNGLTSLDSNLHPTIFQSLDKAGISWRIYETDPGTSYIYKFQPYADQHTANIVPASRFATEAQNGTLPTVALIESSGLSRLDEHPRNNVQTGANYVAGLINALMTSPSWKDSAFILPFDEGGGLYDHVPPVPAVHPDGIPPSDIPPGGICSGVSGGICDFNYTGYRVPLLVVSPFTNKEFRVPYRRRLHRHPQVDRDAV